MSADTRSSRHYIIWAGVAVLLLYFVVRSPSNVAPPSSAGPATAQTKGGIGCLTEAALDRAVTLSSDPEAFAKYVIDPSNGCISLKSGVTVYIDDVKLGKRLIRMPGSTTSVWTIRESIVE